MPDKFLLMGLPATGKTTTFNKCIALLQSEGINCRHYSTDDLINDRMTPENPIILAFQQRYQKRIPASVFTAESKTSAFMREFGEEPAFRDLEEMFIKDILSSANENDWFDFGGKAPLRDGAIDTIRHNKIIPVFLYAEHDTIISRLKLNDGWKNRGNYKNAGEAGWPKLAHEHRADRLPNYINNAAIIIAVEKQNDPNTTKDSPVQLKSTEELAAEIFFQINALKLACTARRNAFTRDTLGFFASPTEEKRLSRLLVPPADLAQCLLKKRCK